MKLTQGGGGMKFNKSLIIWSLLFVLSVGANTACFAKYYEMQKVVSVATYSWGSRGDTVRTIQQKLKNWGYFNGSVDGVFGQQTFEAVQRFQKTNGLTADGIAGNATLEAMGIFEGSTGSTGSTPNTGNTGTSTSPLEPMEVEDDVYLLASAIYGEGRGEPYEGQVAIGAVILNRVDSPQFPNTIPGVVYQKGAFDAVADGQINLTPNEIAIRAAMDAINGWDPSNGALYYWNPSTATSRWIWSVPITKSIGRHVFGTK